MFLSLMHKSDKFNLKLVFNVQPENVLGAMKEDKSADSKQAIQLAATSTTTATATTTTTVYEATTTAILTTKTQQQQVQQQQQHICQLSTLLSSAIAFLSVTHINK